jgi:hypothetical protein
MKSICLTEAFRLSPSFIFKAIKKNHFSRHVLVAVIFLLCLMIATCGSSGAAIGTGQGAAGAAGGLIWGLIDGDVIGSMAAGAAAGAASCAAGGYIAEKQVKKR